MSEVKIPENTEEAMAMALLGMAWLKQKSPEKLTDLHREIIADAILDAANHLKSLITAPPALYGGAYIQLIKYASKVRQGGE